MARMVKCIKLGREAEALDFPPYPGALGAPRNNANSRRSDQHHLDFPA